jgi:DNA-binding NarL/FixJ family response regulator
VTQSWFEDDPEIAQAITSVRGRDSSKLVSYLLQSVIARRRARWADIVLRTALWMREAPPDADLCWRELAIVAKALADGRDLTEIGLMCDIALRTITMFRNAGGRRGSHAKQVTC